MLAKITDTILISFEDARNRIPKAKKIVLTGTPIKINTKQLTESQKNNILKQFNLIDKKPIVLIFGGSQGAKKINEAVIDLLSKKRELDYQIILSAGEKQYNIVLEQCKEKGIEITKNNDIKIFPYIYNMGELEKISDILVCRSGATTIAEISAIGKPAIFVPLPNVSNNHQTFNAKVLENINAAKIIKNDELTGENLHNTIKSMIHNIDNLKIMGENAKKIEIKDIEGKIYKEIKEAIKKY